MVVQLLGPNGQVLMIGTPAEVRTYLLRVVGPSLAAFWLAGFRVEEVMALPLEQEVVG